MDQWYGKVAVVTGASAGIGANIAKALIEKGIKVVGLARRIKQMQKIEQKADNFYPIECDLTKEDDILKSFKYIIQNLGGIDILINNAGIVKSESIIKGTTESYRKVLDTNVIAVAICTREAVKSINERKVSGHIININSILGHNVPIKSASAYNSLSFYVPSKHALTAMGTIFQNEIHEEKLNIKVTNISPALVKTEIAATIGREWVYETEPYLEPKDVTDAVIYALSTPPHVRVSQLTIEPMKIFKN